MTRCFRRSLLSFLLLVASRGASTALSSNGTDPDEGAEHEESVSPVVLLQQNLHLMRPPPRQLRKDHRPNLLLIVLDQWRWDWAGFHEAEVFMPTVKAVAAAGTRFTRAYTTSPLCVPARSSLAAAREYKDMWVQNNQHTYASPQMSPTFMSTLRDAGYTTMLAGKDHLSGDSGNLINATEMEILGVDLFSRSADKYGICLNASRNSAMDHFGLHLKQKNLLGAYCNAMGKMGRGGCCNATTVCETIMMDECGFRCRSEGCIEPDMGVDRWSRLSAEELLLRHWKRSGDKPWFLQLGFPSPHPPFVVHGDHAVGSLPDAVDAQWDTLWIEYGGKMMQVPHPYAAAMNVRHSRETYGKLLAMLDYEIHQILHFLEKHNARENTVVVITSDHGEHLGDHGEWAKSSPWEPSIHIPLIVSGPSVRKNVTEDSPVSLIDVPSTLLDLAQATPAPEMQGYSFAAALRGTGPGARPTVLSGLYMPIWQEGEWRSLPEKFETASALFNGTQFLKLVCCPYGCSKQGTMLPISSEAQVALMNVTSGEGASKFEHDVLNRPPGHGVPEAMHLAQFLSPGYRSACVPLIR